MRLRTWAVALAVAAVAVYLLRTTEKAAVEPAKPGLTSLTVPEGFLVEPAAVDGLVKYPMLGTIAPDGAMYMCESSGKTMKTPEMSASPDYVVSRLVDSDGDGIYDRSTVFADKLTLPAGAVWHRGSLYVAAPPQLLRLEDTNGDGVADVREAVVEGWNLSANAASLHGPTLGPDGWLYLTDGRHGFDIKTKDGREFKGLASRIWRVRPDGTGMEAFAGGGFDNPVEVAFTEGGDMFGTMTYFTDPQAGQRDAILHFVEGGVYPKPHPSMEEFKRTGDLMPVMTKFARIAPAGLLRYRGVTYGVEYQGNLFTAQFNAHRVQRHVVSRVGSTYQTEDSDFLVSTDPDFHPTDVMEAADGSVVVVDTGAWFIHGCPLSRVAKPDVRGTLYRVRRVAAERPGDPRGAEIATFTAEMLDDGRPFVHDRAVEALVETGEASVAPLAAFRGKAATVRGATAAVFALARIGSEAAVEGVRAALRDERWEVRQAAARMLGMKRDKASAAVLAEMVKADKDDGVRRQAATALGQIGEPSWSAALLEAASNPEDRFMEHAIIYSLIQLGEAKVLVSHLQSEDASVRKASLIALDQMDRSPLRESNVLPFLEDTDLGLRRTAFWIVSRHPAWSGRLSKAIERRMRAPDLQEREAEALKDAIASLCGESAMQASVARALGDATLGGARQMLLLDAVERCGAAELPSTWTAGLRGLLGHEDPAVRVRTITLARARGLAALDGEMRKLADSAAEPDDVRVAALSALGARDPSLSEADFTYLLSRLMPAVDAPVKLAAGQVLGRARLSEEQLIMVAQRYLRTVDPLVLPNLLDGFRNSKSEAVGTALVKGLSGMEDSLGTVGAQRVEELVGGYPDTVRSAAQPLVARIGMEREGRLEKLRDLMPVLASKGDAGRGREIFFGAKAGCSGCHTMGAEGGNVGPDLTSIGAIRSGRDLLEAIVLPSESFVPGHEVYRVETAREIYSGVLGKNAPPGTVRLVTGPGDEVLIARKDVVKMGYAPVSLMPEGYEEVLTREELTDLIGYLRGQTSRKAAGGGSD
ncbi:MAG: HEAT repeat domain-containing protein [Bryobacteraceae bacterium]